MKTYPLLILISLLAAGLVLSACGGDSDSGQDAIIITATPNPETVAQLSATAPPTAATTTIGQAASATPSTIPSTVPFLPPTVTPTLTPTPPPTATPTVTLPPGSFGAIVNAENPAPTPLPIAPTLTLAPGVNFGPIVVPGQTAAPTTTPIPTTPLPISTATVTPVEPSPVAPTEALRRDLLGVQIHPHIDSSEFDQVMGYTRDLGVTWVKYQFNWSLLESAPGQYTELFHILRYYAQETHNRGFKVMISVAKAPGWARTPGADGQLREDGPPDDPQVLANFMTGMLQEIGLDANGAPIVDAVEVWNEPNLQREWTGYPMTGENYMRYFGPAYNAIHAFSPQITVITAAPAPTGDSQWSTDDRAWFKGLYNAGLASYGANVAVGIHPYGWGNAPDTRCCTTPSQGWDEAPQFFYLDTIEDYRAIMEANEHANAQLWTTEFGWATFDGLLTSYGERPADPEGQGFYGFITQNDQAQYTLDALYLAQKRDYMGPMILWNLNFATIPGAVDQSNPQTGYGIIDNRWQTRPVYEALKAVTKR